MHSLKYQQFFNESVLEMLVFQLFSDKIYRLFTFLFRPAHAWPDAQNKVISLLFGYYLGHFLSHC